MVDNHLPEKEGLSERISEPHLKLIPINQGGIMQRTIPSVCGGCHNACPMNVVVEGNRVVAAKGVKGDPRTDGALCARGLAAPQIAHDPRRLLYPGKGAKGKRR